MTKNTLINFRCIGGLKAGDGRFVRQGLLLRSGQLTQLDDEGLKRLGVHGVSLVIDLRTAPEIAAAPNDDISGAAYINIDILEAVTQRFVNREEWIKALNPEQATASVLDVYGIFATDPTSRAAFGHFLHALADASGPVLFHCFAGKDRTGFAAALILKVLGVSMDRIFDDYMKTKQERKEANRRDIENYRKKGLSEEQLAGLEIAYCVQSQFLEHTFNAIEEEFGSFENFIKKGLGIDQDLIEKLRDKYLC